MFPIKLLTNTLNKKNQEIYKDNSFESMIKYVVDINNG